MNKKCINPNEYGSLLYDEKEKEYLNNVINQKRIFRYSKCEYPYTLMCEEKLQEILNVKYALLTTNGTSGLKAALIGAGVEKNDRVLISSYTFLATALAVIAVGAIPVPIEIDLDTGLNIDDLKQEIKKGCKAIIAVHFQGRAFDLSEVKKIIKGKKICLIEDACQAFAARYKNKYAGTMGDIGVYSFQQFKQISTGEGGCVVSNKKEIYTRMRNYSDMGAKRDRFPSWDTNDALFGENNRMNNLTGAVLYAQLEKLSMILEKQKKSRDKIMDELKKIPIKNILESKDYKGDTAMNIIIFINNKSQKKLAIELGKENKIELRNMWSSIYYDNKLFKSNYLDSISLRQKECKNTRKIIDKMLVISIPPILNRDEERQIIDFILKLKEKGIME